MEKDNVKIFGVDIVELYDYSISESYNFLKDKTDYLDNINEDEIQTIMYSCYKEVYILLKDGSLYKDNQKIMNNIIALCFITCLSIYAIDKDRRIYSLKKDKSRGDFINNNNCKYKKILFDTLKIVALTYEKTIKVIGISMTDEIIDYEKYMGVDDIGYIEEENDIVIIKDNKIMSLFLNNEYSSNNISVEFNESNDNYMIF